MKPVDVLGLHVESSSGSLLLLLREQDEPHRVLPIVIGENEALAIALALENQAPPRPLTHDLMVSLVESLDARVDRALVTELRDGAFLAELTVTGPHGDMQIDSRPSDAIALAMRVDAPMFVAEDVLDQAGAVLPDVEDDDEDDSDATSLVEGNLDDADATAGPEAIEEEVDRFRAFLDELDPTDFEPPADRDEPDFRHPADLSEPDEPDEPDEPEGPEDRDEPDDRA